MAARAWKVGTRGRAGFTFVEILLVLSLVLLLMGVTALTMGGWRHSMDLEEASQSLVTGLKMARADAANMGLRLQLAFDPTSGQCQLLWEADPLANPGVFTDYTKCTWKAFLENPDVMVTRCDFTGSSSWRTLVNGSTSGTPLITPFGTASGTASAAGSSTGSDQSLLSAITFDPDGSSDSVTIEMVPVDPTSGQHAVIKLDGLTGRITSRIEAISATSTAGSP
jgi:type II secretory pathway pseudopilin PulG